MTDRTYYGGLGVLVVIGAALLPFTMGGALPIWAGWIIVVAVVAWVLAWLITRRYSDDEDGEGDEDDEGGEDRED